MIGALAIGVGAARVQRVSERLAVAFQPEHLPSSRARVAAVLGRRAHALDGVSRHQLDEVPVAAREHREAGAGCIEDLGAGGGVEVDEGCAGLRAAEGVETGEAVAVDVAQARQRAAELCVERRDQRLVRGGQAGRPLDLPAPVEVLETREGNEMPEGVPRPAMGRHAALVVDEGLAAAEGTAGVDPGDVAVEGGEQALDVSRRAQRRRTGIRIRRQDAVGERVEGAPLLGRGTSRARAVTLDARPRATRFDRPQRLQERRRLSRRDGRTMGGGSGGWRAVTGSAGGGSRAGSYRHGSRSVKERRVCGPLRLSRACGTWSPPPRRRDPGCVAGRRRRP